MKMPVELFMIIRRIEKNIYSIWISVKNNTIPMLLAVF